MFIFRRIVRCEVQLTHGVFSRFSKGNAAGSGRLIVNEATSVTSPLRDKAEATSYYRASLTVPPRRSLLIFVNKASTSPPPGPQRR